MTNDDNYEIETYEIDFTDAFKEAVKKAREDLKREKLSKEVGGSHYRRYKDYQPIEFIVDRGYSFIEGNIFKYLTRYKFKNGVEDLEKAKQYCEFWEQFHKKSKLSKTVTIFDFLGKNNIDDTEICDLLVTFDDALTCSDKLMGLSNLILKIEKAIERIE